MFRACRALPKGKHRLEGRKLLERHLEGRNLAENFSHVGLTICMPWHSGTTNAVHLSQIPFQSAVSPTFLKHIRRQQNVGLRTEQY